MEVAMTDFPISPVATSDTPLRSSTPLHVSTRPSGDQDDQHRQNLAVLLHRLLRGRYVILGVLASIGAIGGAAGGYFSQVPKYQAEGTIQVQPVLPKIQFTTESSSVMPMFSSYVSTQAALMQQERVLAKARESDAWRKLGRPVGAEAELEFRRSLRVIPGRESQQLITVTFVDENANAAFVALKEIVRAYEEIHGVSREKREREATVNALNEKRTTQETKRREIQRKIQAILEEFPADDLTRLQEAALNELITLEIRLAEKAAKLVDRGIDPKTVIDAVAAPLPAPNVDPAPPPPPKPMTDDEIARIDPEMAGLLADQTRTERDLARLAAGGQGPKAKAVMIATADIEIIKGKKENIRLRFANVPGVNNGAAALAGAGVTDEQLKDEFRRLSQQVDAVRAKTDNIKRRKGEVEVHRQEMATVDADLAGVLRRLDEVTTEAKSVDSVGGGRIESFLPESPPGTPNVDSRPKMAAVGFVLGTGIPFALLLLLGLVDRRFRYADQARDAASAVPMLGILPELPTGSDVGDPEENAAAVHCVHHIRSLLQMNDGRRKVYVVTSPTAGDGKTSLTLSLAMSFTASGARTLVIDFDLVGCGLTSRLGATRSLGLGDTLVNGNGECQIVATAVPGLDLIPAGRDDARNISRISRKAIASLVDRYRDTYDSILIDTGPALGSLEVNLAASVADGVILVVGRGQHASRVQEALKHIQLLGGLVVGMVFNRAHTTDFARSTMSNSFRSLREGEKHVPRPGAVPNTAIATTDPLARHVESDIHR